MSGMFFPGRLPQPGETWILVEGVKDAAALIGLGFHAAGMPTCELADKYSRLFEGVNVVIVPDLDQPGQRGAQRTGGRLVGIAASVLVVRLPGEIRETNGDDVRDILRRPDGERLVRDAIDNAKPCVPSEPPKSARHRFCSCRPRPRPFPADSHIAERPSPQGRAQLQLPSGGRWWSENHADGCRESSLCRPITLWLDRLQDRLTPEMWARQKQVPSSSM